MTACATNKYNSDRELFSELFENPLRLLIHHIVPPYVNVINSTYDFQLNGERIWKSLWRDVCGKPANLFDHPFLRLQIRGMWLRARMFQLKLLFFRNKKKGTRARVFSSISYSRFRRDKYMFECLRRRHICCRGFG